MRTAIIARAVEAPSFGWLDGGQSGSKTSQNETGFNNWRVHDLSRTVHLFSAPTRRAADVCAEFGSTCVETCSSVTVMRQKRVKLTFARPFRVKGVSRMLPAGDYELVPDQELTAEFYLPAYRPVVALIHMPSQAHRCSSFVKASVDLADILASHRQDQHRAATPAGRG
jgi:hypothetical protein